jgi:hypothetical protein
MQTDYPWVVCRAADWLDLVEGIGPLVNLAVGPLYTLRGIFRVYTLEGRGTVEQLSPSPSNLAVKYQ